MNLPGQLSIFDYDLRSIGSWSKHWDNESIMLRCSNCEAQMFAVLYLQSVGTNGLNFCPYCGAKMNNGRRFFSKKWSDKPVWRIFEDEEKQHSSIPF